MAKAYRKRVEPEPPPDVYVLEMGPGEAAIIRRLLSNVMDSPHWPAHRASMCKQMWQIAINAGFPDTLP